MRSLFDWFAKTHAAAAPWLLLGKGPTLARRRDFDLSRFRTIGLNHVCLHMAVDLAHIIDLDVVEDCGDALIANAGAVVMPWRPHVRARSLPGSGVARTRVSDESLATIAARTPILSRLAADDRLFFYNLSTAPTPHGDSPVVPVRYFSAVAALNLLIAAGVREIRSLGVDGGLEYAGEFDDLRERTRLVGPHATFDLQFGEFAEAIRRRNVLFAPLDVDAPIRIFVGATEAQMLAVKVLEHSIRRRASLSVDVQPIHRLAPPAPAPRDPALRSRTPFSFQRFAVPGLMKRTGRALYLDSDMLVF